MEPLMTTFLIKIDNPDQARGPEPALAFAGLTITSLAEELGAALRTPALFERWRQLQDEPDEVDPALGSTDPTSTVVGKDEGSRHYLEVQTTLPHALLSHRLNMLVGPNWTLRDVR
jgi:hypothetical protein